MSKNIVFEGWLTKSPPTKRIWRTKWRRRWFSLRQSGELPGQYFLDYYADRNCRRLKGTINLDLCEQVDAGLHMERTGNGTLDPKLPGSVFTIQTQQRTYHLEADCEADMQKWVDTICRVCGLRATDEAPNVPGNYQNTLSTLTALNEQYEFGDSTGPYIPISECITGVRTQDAQAFTFDPKSIVLSTRTPLERVSDNRNHHMYMSQPHIRLNQTELSENDSNLSDEECLSLTASQSNIRDWSVAKTFTKLAISPKRNGLSAQSVRDGTISALRRLSCSPEEGPLIGQKRSSGNPAYKNKRPPVPPPRPPKTLPKDIYQGPKIQEPLDIHDGAPIAQSHTLRAKRSPLAPSPGRLPLTPARTTDDEEDGPLSHQSLQYYNLSLLPMASAPPPPPAVDRALKPRHSSIGHINHLLGQAGFQLYGHDDMRNDVLQYLDLDLHSSKPIPVKPYQELPPKREKPKEIAHGKSLSAVESDSAYKTVDFLKTEAFNITRRDAEASRSTQH